jgi:hypothetical protein
VSEVTRLLSAIDHRDPKAAEELLPLLYGDLGRLATVEWLWSVSANFAISIRVDLLLPFRTGPLETAKWPNVLALGFSSPEPCRWAT